jgi:hypothetical protein
LRPAFVAIVVMLAATVLATRVVDSDVVYRSPRVDVLFWWKRDGRAWWCMTWSKSGLNDQPSSCALDKRSRDPGVFLSQLRSRNVLQKEVGTFLTNSTALAAEALVVRGRAGRADDPSGRIMQCETSPPTTSKKRDSVRGSTR